MIPDLVVLFIEPLLVAIGIVLLLGLCRLAAGAAIVAGSISQPLRAG